MMLTAKQDPTLQILTGPSGVPYIARIKANGITWRGRPVSSWVKASLYNLSTHASTVLDGDDFTYAITSTSTVVTVVATGKAPYASIVLTWTFTRTTDGWKARLTKPVSSTGKACESYELFLDLIPQGRTEDFFLSWPVAGGWTVTDPHLVTKAGLLVNPQCMQFWGAYDGFSKAHLYVSTNDDEFNTKSWSFTGQGASTLFWFRQIPDGAHHTADLAYSQPFDLTFECFRGRTPGIRGHWDDTLRYREWATHDDRPWMARPGWLSNANFSDHAKTSHILAWTGGKGTETTFGTDLTKILTYTGGPGMLAQYYDHGAAATTNPDDFGTPDFNKAKAITNVTNAAGLIKITSASHGLSTSNLITIQGVGGVPAANSFPGTTWTVTVLDANNFTLQGSTFAGAYTSGGGFTTVPATRSAVRTMWATLKAGNVHPAPYTRQMMWNSSLTTKYNVANFLGINVAACLLKKSDGTNWGDVATFGGIEGVLDVAQTNDVIATVQTAALVEQIIEWGTPLDAGFPEGIYFDAFHSSNENYDPLRTSWTTRAFNSGLRTSAQQLLTIFKTAQPGGYAMTEVASEHLVDKFELMFLTGSGATFGLHALNNAFAAVYGEHVRLASFENAPGSNNVAEAPGTLAYLSYMWHASGISSLTLPSSLGQLVPGSAPAISDAFYYVFKWMKELETARVARLGTYMSGRLMRPAVVSGDAEADVLAYGEDIVRNLRANAFDHLVQSSTWQAIDTGDIGIVITHHIADVASPLPGSQFSHSRPVTVRVVSADYDLPAGGKTLYRNDSGTRSMIARFTDAIELELDLPVWSITLLEVVPD